MSRKTIEDLKDVGKVYEDGVLLGEYPYHITVSQEILKCSKGRMSSLKLISGKIYMNPDEIMRLMSGEQKPLALYLADGRKLDFSFSKSDGTICAKSDFY